MSTQDIPPLGPVSGEVFLEPIGLTPGRPSQYRNATVKVDIDAATYHALGPIAAHHGKATTAFINAMLAEVVGRKAAGAIAGPKS